MVSNAPFTYRLTRHLQVDGTIVGLRKVAEANAEVLLQKKNALEELREVSIRVNYSKSAYSTFLGKYQKNKSV
jgi:hypothetical protein